MKVLVLFEEVPETACVMLIDMTPEEFAELNPAHAHYLGCYSSSDHKDAISQALCKWNFAIQFMVYPEEAITDRDKEWMDECGVAHSWFNRFDGRVTKLIDMHTANKFDAFISTGLVM